MKESSTLFQSTGQRRAKNTNIKARKDEKQNPQPTRQRLSRLRALNRTKARASFPLACYDLRAPRAKSATFAAVVGFALRHLFYIKPSAHNRQPMAIEITPISKAISNAFPLLGLACFSTSAKARSPNPKRTPERTAVRRFRRVIFEQLPVFQQANSETFAFL